MKHLLRRSLIALALMAGIAPAIAQTFPTVPGQSVIGRRGQPGDTGPSQAILYGTLRSDLKVPTIPSIYAVDSGVKCNGVTDDAPAIQRAINTADVAGNVQIVMPAGTCIQKSANPFLNKWTVPGVLTVPGLNIVGQGKGVTTLDNQTGGFAISVNPDWRAAHLSLSGITATTGGTGLPTNTYFVQITVNTPQGDEVFVTLPKSIAVTSPGHIAVTLAPLNPGYSYNLYCDTTATPAHYCVIGGGNASAFGGSQSVVIDAIGAAQTIPTNKRAVWQQAHVGDLSITSTTATAGSSGISFFKVGYSDLANVYLRNLQGTGFELTDYTGDVDGSFNVSVRNSKFDTIGGWCIDASGLALEMSNFTVEDRTIMNICGTLPTNLIQPQAYSSSGFVISTITNSTTPVITTSVPHTLQSNDQVYIRGVLGMTLADGWYRASVISGTTYNLKDLNGNFIDTTALGTYTGSSGVSMLAWRPPSPTNGVTGCLRWMGLIGTFRNLDFTQCNNVSMYFTELGSSDNATLDGIDFENTYGKALYIASLAGGTITNTECLSAPAFGPTISCLQLGTGFSAGGVQNFQVQNMKVRNTTALVTAFEQFRNTNFTGPSSDSNRVNNVTWQTFDAVGQRRFDGFKFDPIPGQVQFSVSATNTFKLAPTGYGATLPVRLKAKGEVVPIQLPTAGLVTTVTTSSVNTLYNIYVSNTAATTSPYLLAFAASTTGPVLDEGGYYSLSTDSSFMFVGQAKTDASGNFQPAQLQISQYPLQLTLPLAWVGGAASCPTCVLISGTAHGDSNYSILSTDRYVYTNVAFTAPRTWTLPAANSLAVGTTIWVQDAQNTVGATNTLTVQRAGADLINNFSASLLISDAGGGITFTTDGVSNWGVPIQTVTTGGTGRQILVNHAPLIGAGTNPITQGTVGTNGQLWLGVTGLDPAFATMAQDCTITNAGVITCTKTNNVSFAAVATSGSATDLTTGALPAGRMPALTGDCTTSAGAVATTCTKINGVDQTAAWTTYTPTVTSGTGTFTTVSATGRYKQIGKTIHLQVDIVITTAGTAASSLIATLPVASFASTAYSGVGRERAATGASCIGYITTSDATHVNIIPMAGGTIIASGNAVTISITYEAA